MNSIALQDAAIRAAATETAAPGKTAESAETTRQAYARQTDQSAQITDAASTAVMARATEISAESTAQVVRNAALQKQAEYRVTDAWLNGQLTAIPGYVQATGTRYAVVATRQAKIKDAGAWMVVWAAWIIAVLIGLALLRKYAEQAYDALSVAHDMARVKRQAEVTKFDVSKTGGSNGPDTSNQHAGRDTQTGGASASPR